jgi:hypothetical protein
LSGAAGRLAEAAGLLRVDDPLLARRYREGLQALGASSEGPPAFHLDAAGYSPEWAEALGDAFYLGAGPLEASGVLVTPAQLRGPVAHPGFGFAEAAWRRLAAGAAREIAELTLREALLVEAGPEGGGVSEPRALADPEALELRLRTPGGLIEGQRRLAERQREFLASERLWLDDEFLAELANLAGRVRGLPELADGFERARARLAPVLFTPAYGGAYRIEEPGAAAGDASTTLLVVTGSPAAGRSRRGRRIEWLPLEPEAALGVLERHEIARVDPDAWRAQPGALARLRQGLAAALCLAEPERAPASFDAASLEDALRKGAAQLPDGARELEDVTRELAAGRRGPAAGSLAPATRLALAVPTSTRPEVQRSVRHLQAFFAPWDLRLALAEAPDLLFARFASAPAGLRERLAGWLQRESGMAAAPPRP